MVQSYRFSVLLLLAGVLSATDARGDEPNATPVRGCAAVANDFALEVWTKVAVHKCLTCHQKGGDAEESKFVHVDPRKLDADAQDQALKSNRAVLATTAAVKENDESRLLLKVVGKLNHGGEAVLPPDSAEYRLLADYVRRVRGNEATPSPTETPVRPFFEGVAMLDHRKLLRRATLSLAGRLPIDIDN